MFWKKKQQEPREPGFARAKGGLENAARDAIDERPKSAAAPFSGFVKRAEQMEEELEWRYPNGFQAFVQDLAARPVRTMKTAFAVLGEAEDDRLTEALLDSYWGKIPARAQLELVKALFASAKGSDRTLQETKDAVKDARPGDGA